MQNTNPTTDPTPCPDCGADDGCDCSYYRNDLGSSQAYIDYVSEGDPYGGIGGYDDW